MEGHEFALAGGVDAAVALVDRTPLAEHGDGAAQRAHGYIELIAQGGHGHVVVLLNIIFNSFQFLLVHKILLCIINSKLSLFGCHIFEMFPHIRHLTADR